MSENSAARRGRADAADGPAAERVVLSYRDGAVEPGEGSDWTDARAEWVREELASDTYRRYLRRVRAGPVREGDEWNEFVTCGCASPQDVLLRVERVESGAELTPETELAFVAGNGTDAEGGDVGESAGADGRAPERAD